MTLTEKWDKGELPEGDYYIKRRNGDFLYDNIDTSGVWRNSIDEDILEVLAPVPSYDEWQRIFHYAGKYEYEYTSCVMDYENLKQENKQLKELLKECEEMFVKMYETNTVNSVFIGLYENIKTKIDKVIGEKR